MSEMDTVKAVIEYITAMGGLALRANSGAMKIENTQTGTTRLFRGMAAGTSDILACYKGRFLAIECKEPGNTTTQLQEDFLQRVANAEGIAMVAYSVDDVIKFITEVLP